MDSVCGADFQRHVDARGSGDLHLEALADILLEPRDT